jgi:hypothetical protein
MKKFRHEERFLKTLTEKNGEMLSIIDLTDYHGLTPNDLIQRPKFIPYFFEGTQYTDDLMYQESIFVMDNNIYIYLSKGDPSISSFSCRIYYPIEKRKDVEFFILNLKKLKKNGN